MSHPSRLALAAVNTAARAANAALDLAFAPATVRRLRAENADLVRQRDWLQAVANQLTEAAGDHAATLRALVTLDDDAEEYEPAAPVYGPAVIEQHAAEFSREIDARLDDVIEGWAK